jgi:hypothetical protein
VFFRLPTKSLIFYSFLLHYQFTLTSLKNNQYQMSHPDLKAACWDEAVRYMSRVEFANESRLAYDTARINGWLDDICMHMRPVKKTARRGHWDDLENCQLEALKYWTRTSFSKRSGGAYQAAQKRGWLEIVCSHMKPSLMTVPHGYWDIKDNCRNEAKQYCTRNEFKRGSPSSYNAARMNSWLDEICSHMKSPHHKCYEVLPRLEPV